MTNMSTKEQEYQPKDRLRDQASFAIREGEREVKQLVGEAEKSIKKTIAEGKENMQQIASILDKQVRSNPWTSLAGVAASCLFIGFLMGASQRGE